jgi:branched-chain amino acid transport system permease protein
MELVLLFALLGLGTGALIAGIALGVVLTYRGSGIINLATGAVAMVAGYAFWSLKTGFFFGLVLPTAAALAATLVVAPLVAGLSPDQLSLVNTLLASLVAGAVGVLAASLVQLDSSALPLQIVPALAAALLARFTSFGVACGAGLGIGMAQSLTYYASTQSWFPTDHGNPLPGVQQLLVFVIIVIAMFWRGASLPGRGELVEKRLPSVPLPERLGRPAATATLVCAVALVVLPYDFRQALINSLIGAIIVMSYVVITGYVGQISVVQWRSPAWPASPSPTWPPTRASASRSARSSRSP